MSNFGYFKIPRELLSDPIFKGFSYEYRHIFLTILANVAFKPVKLDDHGVLIELKPGQFMTTVRDLARLCNEKDIDKSKVERALSKFFNVGFSRQETRHTKTIITITEPSICKLIENENETSFETTSRQDRDKIETQKKKEKKEKNENNIITDDLAVVEKDKDLSLGLDNSLKTKENTQIIKAQDLNSSEITSDNICYVLDNQELTQKSNDKSQAENSQAKKAKVKIKPSDEVLLIFEFFKQSLDTHFKEIKTVPSLVDAKHFNSLVEKYDPEKIKEVISFAHTHHFWSSLTLTPSKFNKNFDSLLVQQKKGPSPPGQSRAVLGGKLQTEYNNLF